MKFKYNRWHIAVRTLILIVLLSLAYAIQSYAMVDAQAQEDEDAPQAGTTYAVQRGDTLARIAAYAYDDGDLFELLCQYNDLSDCHNIVVGQAIVIPLREALGQAPAPPESRPATPAVPVSASADAALEQIPVEMRVHLREIQPGDTLAAISQEVYNNDDHAPRLCQYNMIPNCASLTPGMRILVPPVDEVLWPQRGPYKFVPPIPVATPTPDANETATPEPETPDDPATPAPETPADPTPGTTPTPDANGAATIPEPETPDDPATPAPETPADPTPDATPTPDANGAATIPEPETPDDPATPAPETPVPLLAPSFRVPPGNHLVNFLDQDARLEIFAYALQLTALPQLLVQPGPFTVFVPGDAAWVAADTSVIQSLLANVDTLTRTLRSYVVEGNLSAEDLAQRETVTSIEGDVWRISRADDGRLQIGDAHLLESDDEPTNGTIHILNNVVQP